MPPEEAKLPAETNQGDQAAFDDLFARHEAALYRFTRYLTREPELAEELYQETWLRAARHLRRCSAHDLPRDFRQWLFAVAANLLSDERRKRKVRNRVHGGSRDAEESTVDERTAAPNPEFAEQLALREGLERALAALTEKQRLAFLLVHVEGFRTQEVADMLDIAPGTVKSTVFRAARVLREQMSEFKQ